MCSHRHRRTAFTLIELLVVIALVLIITAIAVVAMPSTADRNMQKSADQLQGWLLICKQRAKRDGRPTGLRILFNGGTTATQCAYVQQPEDYAPYGTICQCGSAAGASPNVTFANGTTAIIDLVGAGVQTGDYLEFNRGGGVYQIASVSSATTLTLAVNGPNLYSATNNPTATTTEWRIRRQPDLITGEEVLSLPDGIAIDNSVSAVTGKPQCLNLPARGEVVFSPQGGLVGTGSGSDQICVLWLSNLNNVSSVPLLMAIQAHSGLIAVQQQNTGGADPYLNCRDARASGL